MEDKLLVIISDLFKVPKDSLKDSLTMNDIQLWDSMRHMELIVMIENSFKIQLSFEDIVAMKSIGEIRKIVLSKAS
jgi:acyl carrier protein